MKKVLPTLLDAGHGCVFVNLRAGVFRRRLEHMHQLHGMDVSAVGVEERSRVDLGADRANEPLLIPELNRHAQGSCLLHIGFRRSDILGGDEYLQSAVCLQLAVDAGREAELRQLPDVAGCQVVDLLVDGRSGAEMHIPVCGHRQHHGAVSSRGSVPTALRFQDDDALVRGDAADVVGGGKSREAAAEDRDIYSDVLRQRRILRRLTSRPIAAVGLKLQRFPPDPGRYLVQADGTEQRAATREGYLS